MIRSIDFQTLRFAEPSYLWLLPLTAVLLVAWGWQVIRRHRAARQFAQQRLLPVPERYTLVGELAFWGCLLVAASFCILALARPQLRTAAVRSGTADIVVLLDGSASMYVNDVKPDRWQRSVSFLRTFAETLSWRGDRVALALFAHVAAPQVRLTSDPNSLFFFLDHLSARSPFRLEDDTTWDTNIEEGLYWGLKVIEKDEEFYGATKNAKAFLVVSDGQAWSGRVEQALADAHARRIPVFVAGVGTTSGGIIPEPARPDGSEPPAPVRAVLDRNALGAIAREGGGKYFDIGSGPDRDVAFNIIEAVKNRPGGGMVEEQFDELYKRFLFAAAVALCAGTLVLKKRTELGWQAAAATAALLALSSAVW